MLNIKIMYIVMYKNQQSTKMEVFGFLGEASKQLIYEYEITVY